MYLGWGWGSLETSQSPYSRQLDVQHFVHTQQLLCIVDALYVMITI